MLDSIAHAENRAAANQAAARAGELVSDETADSVAEISLERATELAVSNHAPAQIHRRIARAYASLAGAPSDRDAELAAHGDQAALTRVLRARFHHARHMLLAAETWSRVGDIEQANAAYGSVVDSAVQIEPVIERLRRNASAADRNAAADFEIYREQARAAIRD